jgi:Protein kinase domain
MAGYTAVATVAARALGMETTPEGMTSGLPVRPGAGVARPNHYYLGIERGRVREGGRSMQQHPAMAQQAAPPRAPVYQVPGMPPPLPPGTILFDRYLIQGYIGGGGFSHIYKALDNALGFRRAIKEAFYHDPLTRRQFHLEAEFLLNIHHPNLVGGYAVFEQAGRLYLVMDYVDGHTLEEIAIDHIRRTGWPLPEARILDWVIPICGALHALHSTPVPVIHRDVKPANVKVNRVGVPVLIDLGLAKLYARGTQTIGAALAFTPGYAPPEQYQASGATDARTDVYGMGASLFYLLTGYQPTEAPARIGSLAAPPLRQLNPHLSQLTERTVLRAMELLPANRQQSALELERDLRFARAALPDAPVQAGAQALPRACQSCGALNPSIARHCMQCGTRLASWQTTMVRSTGSAGTEGTPQPAATGADPRARQEPPAEPEEAAEAIVSVGDAEPEDDMGGARTDSEPSAQGLPTGDGQVSAMADAQIPDATETAPGEWWRAQLPVAQREGVEAAPAPIGGADDAPLPAGAQDTGLPAQLGLTPGPASVPDQPAMAMPPLRRGPAPAAMPLHPSGGHGEPARPPALHEPLWYTGSAGDRASAPGAATPARAASAERTPAPGAPRRAIPARGLSQAALVRLPALRQWQAETLAAAPPDDAEARAVIAAALAAVLAVAALQGVHTWAILGAALASRAWLSLSGNILLPVACAAGALALGHWCLNAQGANPIREVRWLARLALALAYVWLALYVIGTLFVALHAR